MAEEKIVAAEEAVEEQKAPAKKAAAKPAAEKKPAAKKACLLYTSPGTMTRWMHWRQASRWWPRRILPRRQPLPACWRTGSPKRSRACVYSAALRMRTLSFIFNNGEARSFGPCCRTSISPCRNYNGS